MTTSSSPHQALHRDALIAGLGLLLMAVLAGLATFGILERLVTDGDAARTASDSIAAFGSFRLAILALFGVAVLARTARNRRTSSDEHQLGAVSDSTTIRNNGPESRS